MWKQMYQPSMHKATPLAHFMLPTADSYENQIGMTGIEIPLPLPHAMRNILRMTMTAGMSQ